MMMMMMMMTQDVWVRNCRATSWSPMQVTTESGQSQLWCEDGHNIYSVVFSVFFKFLLAKTTFMLMMMTTIRKILNGNGSQSDSNGKKTDLRIQVAIQQCPLFQLNLVIFSDPISSYCPIQYRHIVRSNIVIFSDPILSYCPIQYRLVILSNLISSYCRIQYPFPSHRLARHNKSGLLLLSLYRHNHHCRMIIPTLYQDLIWPNMRSKQFVLKLSRPEVPTARLLVTLIYIWIVQTLLNTIREGHQ